ncbi:hypothetical protein BUALT_Bualt06G0018000 [Buddleja alternifolia]|uniref:DUF659 domain-containing protein n=1 Tax=Buddleja alternifolia TaxID=168488 RepID=A0AAV6XDC6_9LAMI|nr:hypothetical protein BUALT_Bualt06G0018000 [Buddleja alternifolia]
MHINDEADNRVRKKVNCLYCDIATKDLSWLKCHLAGTGGAVFPCPKVPIDLKETLRNELLENEKEDLNVPMKRSSCTYMDTLKSGPTQTHVNEKRCKTEPSENSGIESKVTLKNPQASFTSADDSLSRKVKGHIGKFFYESGLDLDAVNLPSFQKMISLCSGETKYQIPTPQELKGSIFKDVMKEMSDYVNDVRNSWADTGCSILLDGWTDEKGRNMINILVDCPKGTIYLHSSDISDIIGNLDSMQLFFEKILMEVGIRNVVQIITYSTEAVMKEVGKVLMDKYRPIFWTVSASCCIELMLEKLGTMDLIKETFQKAKVITKFIYSRPDVLKFMKERTEGRDLVQRSKKSIIPFLTIENIVLEKEILKTMCLSSDSQSLFITSCVEGKRVAELVADRSFWSGASIVLKAAIPLVRVIEWLDENIEVQIAYIYETIDQAKETIKEGFKHKKSQYMPYWKVIDDVWNEHLYSPLHAAGYFLNPNLFYSSDVYIDPEVATGLLCCIVRSTEDIRLQDRITVQMEQYRTAKGDFGVGSVVDKRSDTSPARWWSKYGGGCPQLQRLAIRSLSQPCDGASRFHLKRGLAETLLTQGRNQIEQKRLTDITFLRYNMQLQNFACGRTDYLRLNEMDPARDWLVDKSQNDDLECMEMGAGETTEEFY